MLRILALLCSLALLLAPLGAAQAEPACAMLAVSQDTVHATHEADHQMTMPGHPGQICKQLCAVVGILTPPDPDLANSFTVRPVPRPVASLLNSLPAGPSERPPKLLV